MDNFSSNHLNRQHAESSNFRSASNTILLVSILVKKRGRCHVHLSENLECFVLATRTGLRLIFVVVYKFSFWQPFSHSTTNPLTCSNFPASARQKYLSQDLASKDDSVSFTYHSSFVQKTRYGTIIALETISRWKRK